MMPVLAAFAFLVTAGSARAEVVLDESFDQPTLSARWEWRVPVPGPTYSLTERPGWFRLRVPQHQGGYNHWLETANAPMLVTAAPEGDWDAECRLQLTEAPPGSNFHLGFTVVYSPQRLLTLGPFFGPFAPMTEPEVWLEPTGQGSYAKAGAPAKDISLLFKKRGWLYEAYLKRPGDADWKLVGRYSSSGKPEGLGIVGKTFFDGPGVVLDVDYVRLVSVPVQAPSPQALDTTVRVQAGAAPTRLSPRRYGEFLELMRRAFYGGLWAEMLTNRKLTGEVAASGVIEGWQPVGAGKGVLFSRDNDVYFVPAQSQRIECPADGQEHGLEQTGLELAPGVGLVGRVVLRAEGLHGTVAVSLRYQGAVVEAKTVQPTAEWQTFDLRFGSPRAAGRLAAVDSLAITTRASGKLWVGCASLMPADNVEGFRADVLALVQKLHIPFLRYPGGNFVSGYHWEDGIGPRDRRPPRWSRAWQEWEWNDVGTHEYFRLCELLGCEPYLTVNAGEGSPSEAAAWVEYVNGGPGTVQGKRRAANGHPKPFGCRVFSIGNEMYGDWQLGHLDATKYAIRTAEFARAMRAVSPDLELIGDGVLGPNPWNVTLARVAGRALDFVSVHHYTGDDGSRSPLDNYGAILGTPRDVERALAATYLQVQANVGRAKPLPLIFDEWNVWTQHASAQGYEDFYLLRDGLYVVSMLNVLTRMGDMVPAANLAMPVNVLGAVRTDKTRAVASPEALAFQLHTEHSGPWRVPIEVKTPEVLLPGTKGPIPAVDAIATLSEDKTQLHVILLNRHPELDAPVTLRLEGFEPKAGTTTLLSAPSFEACNTFDAPHAVTLTDAKLPPGGWQPLTLPKHSAMAVSLTR